MQLGRPADDVRLATTLPAALAAATRARGHRPALTVLGAGPDRGRRDEQAFASLHQWVAKGAHLLEVDAMLEPGDRVHLDAPAGWLPAAVCLAAWWVGAVVTDRADGAVVSIVHESRAADSPDGWVLGDAVDGGPAGTVGGEPWSVAVQAFPDRPPSSRATADTPALDVAGVASALTQADLLRIARDQPSGRLGVRAPLDLLALAVQLAARPAATADPTVLVVDATDDAVAAEAVAHWWDEVRPIGRLK